MRRLLLLLPLLAPPLAPLAAAAQGGRDAAFCDGLRQIVVAAGSDFDSLPRGQRLIPGSIEERRGTVQSDDGPPRGAIFITLMRDRSRERPQPARARFAAVQGEISRCLPEAVASPDAGGQDGQRISWTMQMAVVRLRLDTGEGDASTAEVELSVASRW